MPAVDVELPAEASSASAARVALRALFAEAAATGRRASAAAAAANAQAFDRVLLLTSELVTNAILHARTPLRLTAVLDGGEVVVRVYDTLRTPPRRRAYRSDAGTGRGMHLVEALADRWGVEEASAGKCVWFAVDLGQGAQAARLG